ncbi:hypothetical protein [Roseibium polysiphoniae]|uniref:hypothetical protein n=1 Tax=Roseibium polysiphoniae TaxID=2571221 RepID=UPI001BCD9A87|nr:hypothetical protein [Roseibium polysiphoniae]
MRDKLGFPLSFVIAGLDPAIHAVSSLKIEVVPRGKVTAWMPWSGHGMTEWRRGFAFGPRVIREVVGDPASSAFPAQAGIQ